TPREAAGERPAALPGVIRPQEDPDDQHGYHFDLGNQRRIGSWRSGRRSTTRLLARVLTASPRTPSAISASPTVTDGRPFATTCAPSSTRDIPRFMTWPNGRILAWWTAQDFSVTMTPDDKRRHAVRPVMTHFFYMDATDPTKVRHWIGSVGPVAF